MHGVMTRATLFRCRGGQGVRLPEACRFECEEVLIHREGRRVILEPADGWPASFLAVLGAWRQPVGRPRQGAVTKLRDPFAGS